MKLTVQIQLLPDADQSRRLRETVERFNAAANWISGVLFEHRTTNVFEARKLVYHPVRERFGLSSQMAQLAIKAVCDAFKRDRSIRPELRPLAAMPFDQRTMSFKGIDRVSLLTLDGRVVVPFILGAYQAERMTLPRGQCDLVLRDDGKWFLLVAVDVPEAAPIPVTDFIGIDLGIANVATDSDGNIHTGEEVERIRRKHNLQRKRLQRKGTRGAKKKLRRVARKESRFRAHKNHCISKKIVETARRTGRGIALEDLSGIRERIRARGGDARNRLSGWSFGQLGTFIQYKARLVGVPVEFVDPAYTSQTCPVCHHRGRSNRPSQAEFRCQCCGFADHADIVGARNIRNAVLVQTGALAVT